MNNNKKKNHKLYMESKLVAHHIQYKIIIYMANIRDLTMRLKLYSMLN